MTHVYAVRFDPSDDRMPLKILKDGRCDTEEEANELFDDIKLSYKDFWMPVYVIMQHGNMVVREEKAS